ncbi:MAG: flagellar biosynthesis regulator FlaF [Pseudomonadota bacterium]
MSSAQQAHLAYARAGAEVRSPRATEYAAFSRISHTLRDAAMHQKTNYPAFVSALSDNRQLWTTLAVDVADQKNALPQDLRARLFWLAEFTEEETRKILRGSGDVGVLIEINAAVMQGLRGTEDAS